MKPLLIIGGATGTGKSNIAVACAKKLNGEVISADSMQIYRGLDIGTAKIRADETEGIAHYMIDVADPKDGFTAAEYKERVRELIRNISERGKTPILCGGTGLYINAVLYDLSFSGEFDPDLRQELLAECAQYGKAYMHDKLAALDPDAAERLHVNDEKRVIRAIEKALTGGKKENDFSQAKYPYCMFITDLPRDRMYERIELRVDKMMQAGLKEEVTGLIKQGIGFDKQCMQAIAYKEWAPYFEGEASEEDVVALIKKNTRNYAKRQVTWFKQYKDAEKIDVTLPMDEIVEIIAAKYQEVTE